MSDPDDLEPVAEEPDVPDWDDEFVDRVSGRLMFHYDLEKDVTVDGRRFTMYGELTMVSQKHFLHPALSYAHHQTTEHLFVARVPDVSVADLEGLVALGHDLSGEWIEADEEHYGTDFTFVVLADSIPGPVREFVDGFRERTLLKYGYYGHYEIHLAVVAPDEEDIVMSRETDVGDAFRLWESVEEDDEPRGLLERLLG